MIPNAVEASVTPVPLVKKPITAVTLANIKASVTSSGAGSTEEESTGDILNRGASCKVQIDQGEVEASQVAKLIAFIYPLAFNWGCFKLVNL